MWDQDKAAPLTSFKSFLADPLAGATCFRVGGQASQQVPMMRFGGVGVGSALLASGSTASLVPCSPAPFSGQLLFCWKCSLSLFFFPLLPGFYPDNYKELCFNCQNHDTFPVSSSLPDFRWAVKAFGLDPESCASPQFRNDGYIFLTNTNCLFAAHPITRNTIKYHKATAAIISGHRVLRSKGALDIVSCIRHVISALGYLHTN